MPSASDRTPPQIAATTLDERDVVAVRIAWDELVSYIEAVGDEGSLDDEEMPNGKLAWAEARLRAILERAGEKL